MKLAQLKKTYSGGQATLLFVFALLLVASIVLMNALSVFSNNYSYIANEFDQVLLDEATSSSFAVMESALARRMWEPPPDSNCLKSDKFSVSGDLDNGISWKTEVVFNFTTKNFEMTATGTFHRLNSLFKKHIKALDASDYLLFSAGKDTIQMGRIYNDKAPTSIIAKDRRVYSNGPIQFYGVLARATNNTSNWLGSPSLWPGEYGTILQGDRMQFAGGLSYYQYPIPQPNAGQDPLISMLAPYSYPWGGTPSYYAQSGAGAVVITNNYSVATTLSQQIIDGTAGPQSKASIAKNVYPIALFNGTPPLEAWKASDTGAYFNDPDRYSIFTYGYALANNYGTRMDATCITQASTADKKYCSNSEHFPKSFNKWRKDASLDGYLFTSDAEVIPSPSINWDNLESLEDDAKVCGAVISTPTNDYKDCPIWDTNFMTQYAASGSTDGCLRISRIDMENINLNNFNSAQLNDPALKDRLLRRIVYTKVPIEIKQSNPSGLMISSVPDDVTRKNLSIWFVGEDLLTVKGYQQDTSSPLTVDPGRLREIVFNKDGTGAGKVPLSIVLFSPEKIHLISPFYVPMDSGHFTSYWPASGGTIHPINQNLTDAYRQENDGFKYGYRRYLMDNIGVITSTANSASSPFYLQGLWAASDSSASQMPANLCMVSLAGQTTGTSYSNFPMSPIPPLGSNYYGGLSTLPYNNVPQVFAVQNANGQGHRIESDVVLTGIRINLEVSASTPTGKRDLSVPKYLHADSRYMNYALFDISHKNFEWNIGVYYKDRPPGTPCTLNNVEFRTPSAGYLYDNWAINPSINNGSYVFSHNSPPDDYRNLGAIVGVDQPLIETRNSN